MIRAIWLIPVMVLCAARLDMAQAPKPFQAQSASTIAYRVEKDEQIVESVNVAYSVTGTDVPGRPKNERLVLRTTARSKQVLGDIGEEATVTAEAWPLGAGLHTKPLYTLSETGVEAHTLENALWQFARGTEEVQWWSIYQLGTGRHLFDTYVPPINFSISREFVVSRYGALDVPPDDAADARMKEPHVVAVVVYASPEKVIREALITCDDVPRAKELRSYADTTRTLTLRESPSLPPVLRIRFVSNTPQARETLLELPVIKDDLDVGNAKVPAGMHIKAWKP